MNKANIIERQIKFHRKLYAQGKPKISNEKYDALEEQLRKLKPDSLLLKQVGYPVKRRKISLPFILGSLDKVNVNNVLAWIKKQNDHVLMSWKLDGGSIYAEWNNGKLTSLATRGDGKIGEDILFKAHKIKNLPQNIPENGRVCARGEVVVRRIPERYKNKRNAATGILNRDDFKGMHYIMVWFYELIKHPKLPKTEEKRFELMENLFGLYVSPHYLLTKDMINEETIDFLEATLKTSKDHSKYSLDVDGLVLSKNKSHRENVEFPKNKIAFKIPEKAIATKVTEIEWSVTRTGRIVPVVHIETIETQGVEINHPTGHNLKWVADRKVDKGAKIEVIRSGDVIPYISNVLKPAKKFRFPQKCPICNKPTTVIEPDLMCTNQNCPGIMIAQLEYFIKTLGAENIAFATMQRLYEEKLVKTIQDFYEIKKEDLVKVEGLGDISADTILEERAKTLKVTPEKLLAAFGIPLVGLKMAKKIVDNHHFSRKFGFLFRMNEKTMYNTLIAIEGIGPSIGESFVDEIYNFKELYKYLKKKGMKLVYEKKTNKLKGKSFQFTGVMSKAREEMEILTMNNGGRLSAVNKKLDFLVMADKNSTSSKAKKARKLGVKIITENKFIKMVGG